MDEPDLFAYMGEDEHGSGEIGIKAALVPAGFIPIVAVDRDRHKIERDGVVDSLHAQAMIYGKQIRLVRYVPVEVVRVIDPS